jgi:SAM-dependent methyltransferase
LGARFGTEVKAFHDLGSFAVGIDVRTGERNKFVLQGDFHDIQFPAATVDIVFTNSLDHAFDFEKVIQEIRRVLKPSGTLWSRRSGAARKDIRPGAMRPSTGPGSRTWPIALSHEVSPWSTVTASRSLGQAITFGSS